VEEARGFVAEGYRAMKLRIGKRRMEEDVERCELYVRPSGGRGPHGRRQPAFHGGACHPAWTKTRRTEHHLVRGTGPAYDFEGSARVAAALDVPIASGENVHTAMFRRMLETKAADILMQTLCMWVESQNS